MKILNMFSETLNGAKDFSTSFTWMFSLESGILKEFVRDPTTMAFLMRTHGALGAIAASTILAGEGFESSVGHFM